MADYVTVVEVDDRTSKDSNLLLHKTPPLAQTQTDEDPSFITVLSINNNSNLPHINDKQQFSRDTKPTEIESVVVYRLPGERLGFGLKFQGGTRSTEKVQKLFIQSCAKDSPASKGLTSWGQLREGEEIVKIYDQYVKDMTRIECVKGLKDNVAIKLDVRNGRGLKPLDIEEEFEQQTTGNLITFKGPLHNSGGQMKGAPPPPPPVPPRKLIKKSNTFKESTGEAALQQHYETTQGNEMDAAVTHDKSFTPPPDAEFYINLFAENNANHHTGHHLLRHHTAESESDDTASTISTVIDRYSIASNYSSETDLSGFTSLTNGQGAVINKPELAKVLKPFTMLEQEFKLNNPNEDALTNVLDSSLDLDLNPITLIPGNNYENIEFKTQKINVYENMELKPKEEEEEHREKEEEKPHIEEEVKQLTPTPKPRQQVLAQIEPKKRSIIPMPRKLTNTGKQAIEVKPPKVPETVPEKTSTETKTPTTPSTPNTPTTPTNENVKAKELTSKQVINASPNVTKEFVTKIPKAINSPMAAQQRERSSMERSKTESEIKLKPQSKLEKLKLQTSEFLEKEATKLNKTPSPIKSRIPIHLTAKRSLELDSPTVNKIGNTSPTNIQTKRLTKQKSETDLNLNYLINNSSKESSVVSHSKIPLQRTTSAEAKFKSPERTLIPILQQSATTTLNSSSTESINSTASTTKNRGPKPKPPERVQSLPKTNIPKLALNNVTTVAVVDRTVSTPTTPPLNSAVPSMQTFKQTLNKTPEKPVQSSTVATNTSNNREVLFKIQTYESKTQTQNKEPISIYHTEEEHLPSLFELQRRSSPPSDGKNEVEHNNSSSSSSKESSPLNKIRNLFNEETPTLALEDDLDCTTPPPLVVGKCMKIEDTTAPLYYSSSSSDEEDITDSNTYGHDEDKDYICEDGEKLGPPELINGPGPSEAYFNLYWHSNMLPTIGEVEEECSSLEPQSLTNGPIVIVDDLSQQKSVIKTESVLAKEELEKTKNRPEQQQTANNSVTINTKTKKPVFIGVPVLPPTVPLTELQSLKKKDNKTKLSAQNIKEESETKQTINNESESELKKELKSHAETKEMDRLLETKPLNSSQETLSEIQTNKESVKTASKEVGENKTQLSETNKTKISAQNVKEESATKQMINNGSESELKEELKSHAETKEMDKLLETRPLNSSQETLNEIQTNKESVKTASKEVSENKTQLSETSQEVQTETKQTTTKTKTSTTTTTKKIIKSSTTSSTVMESKTCDNLLDSLDDLPEEFKKVLVECKTPDSPKTIAFSLQPYSERVGNTKITVLEERQFESDQKAYAEIRTRDRETGEEKVQKSSETHKEKAKLKKVHSQDDNIDNNKVSVQQPITVTAQAETRLSEEALNPQDNQSIVRGILNLSECGKQLQANQQGGLDLIECEHQILDTFEDSEQIVSPNTTTTNTEKPKSESEKPSVIREISETLTISKDGEKQVTKRSELTKEEPLEIPAFTEEASKVLSMEAQQLITDETHQFIDAVLKDAEKQVNKKLDAPKETIKKGPKLVKKTEEEKKLEMEAQKLIESYQKVKKEAEKLFQYESKAFLEDEAGFDLGELEDEAKANQRPKDNKERADGFEVMKEIEEIKTEPLIITPSSSEDFIDNEPVYVLHKHIIEPTKSPNEDIEVTEIIKIEEELIKPQKRVEEIQDVAVNNKETEGDPKENSSTEIPTEAALVQESKTEAPLLFYVTKDDTKLKTATEVQKEPEIDSSTEITPKEQIEIEMKTATEVQNETEIDPSTEITPKEQIEIVRDKKHEILTEIKTETNPEIVTDNKSEAGMEIKAEEKTEMKPAIVNDKQAENTTETKAELKLDNVNVQKPSRLPNEIKDETKSFIINEKKLETALKIKDEKQAESIMPIKSETKPEDVTQKMKSVKLSPRLKKSSKKIESKEEPTSPKMKTKPKPIPKPKPPVPQKRGEATIVKPIPKRRGSLETSNQQHTVEPKVEAAHKPPTPISEIPKPMERIIVGVEHHIVIPTAATIKAGDKVKTTTPVITLASENLPTTVERQSSLHSNMPVLAQTSSGELLETIHLPNVVSNMDVAHETNDLILTSSSADSVKSAIKMEATKKSEEQQYNKGEKDQQQQQLKRQDADNDIGGNQDEKEQNRKDYFHNSFYL